MNTIVFRFSDIATQQIELDQALGHSFEFVMVAIQDRGDRGDLFGE